jgi:RNA polymerase sigma-70 factor (ECF subfamily)
VLKDADMMWPKHEEVDRLLEAVRQGKAGAVTQLLSAHRDVLRRMLALRLDPALARRLDASDVVQDVLLEASQRLEAYLANPVMPFHLWLRQIAQDQMIDAHRRHRQAQRRSLDREQPLRPATGTPSSLDLASAAFIDRDLTPAAAAMRKEWAERFRQAVDQLPDEDREIILQRHVEQLSNQEVALLWQLSEAAASMRYLRALRRLRALLGEEEKSTTE